MRVRATVFSYYRQYLPDSRQQVVIFRHDKRMISKIKEYIIASPLSLIKLQT